MKNFIRSLFYTFLVCVIPTITLSVNISSPHQNNTSTEFSQSSSNNANAIINDKSDDQKTLNPQLATFITNFIQTQQNLHNPDLTKSFSTLIFDNKSMLGKWNATKNYVCSIPWRIKLAKTRHDFVAGLLESNDPDEQYRLFQEQTVNHEEFHPFLLTLCRSSQITPLVKKA